MEPLGRISSLIADSSFLKFQLSLGQHLDTSSYNQLDTTYIYYYDLFTCDDYKQEDSIVSIKNINVVKEVARGDKIAKSDYFVSDTLVLHNPIQEYVYTRIYESHDTVIIRVYNYNCYKYRIERDKVVFLGLKVKDKLGWLRMSIIGSYNIAIFETTIQN